jgi:hypothetical protein
MFAETPILEELPGREGLTILLIVAVAVVTIALWSVWLSWMRPYVQFLGERRSGKLARWLPFWDYWRARRTGKRLGHQPWFVTWFIIMLVLDVVLLSTTLLLWFKGPAPWHS